MFDSDESSAGVNQWGSSSSSSSALVGGQAAGSSRPSHTLSNATTDSSEKEVSTGSDSDVPTHNFVALRPLYSAAPQPSAEYGLPFTVPDVRLAQRSRKGHRKSRQGCFNCKRRKIKCQEALPACDNCIRKELVCEYPLVKAPSLLQACSQNASGPLVPVQLQTTPIFSLVDMRLFHHFLFNAYPHLPVGNDVVWIRRVPAVAYQYEYLMHALLGLAASHLTVTSEDDYSALALSHRLLAIKGFNEALSKTPRNSSDGDALLAACYALTFQSSYMKDGMSEFLTMVRGCGLVSFQLLHDQVDISFSINPNRHFEIMESRLDNLPKVDADLYEGAISSFEALLPLCKDEAHIILHTALNDCVTTLAVDSRQSYHKFISIYRVLGKMDQQHFRVFSEGTSDVSQLLLAHFVAVEIMMAPILGREWNGRFMSTPMEGILQWLDKINDGVDPNLRSFLSWPASLATCIKAEISGEKPYRPWLRGVFMKENWNEIPA